MCVTESVIILTNTLTTVNESSVLQLTVCNSCLLAGICDLSFRKCFDRVTLQQYLQRYAPIEAVTVKMYWIVSVLVTATTSHSTLCHG